MGDLGIKPGGAGQSDWHLIAILGDVPVSSVPSTGTHPSCWRTNQNLTTPAAFEHVGSASLFMGWLDEQQHKEGWDMTVEILVRDSSLGETGLH